MFARSLRAGVAVTALVASGLAIGGPALADPTFTPGAAGTDYVGVGSDTTQIVMNDLALAFNATAPANRIASWDACIQSGTTCTPGGNITLRTGAAAIARPNGSGAGKALLFGSGNNANVDFARSSSGNSTAETNAGLVAYPYAVDYLTTVVSRNVASHAPSALSLGQVLGIYNGTFTNWSQLGGAAGVIKPYIPQTGSGTRSFFLAQLQAANGGVAPTLASTVTETQEHDPTAIQNNPDAIAPFSRGRATTGATNGTVRVEDGYVAQRAVYNVVRGGAPAGLTGLFNASGFFCNAAQQATIEADGFRQMTTGCGVATTTSSSDFTVRGSSGVPANTSSLSVSAAPRGYGAASSAVVNVTNGGTGFVTISGRGFTAVSAVSGASASVAIPATVPAGSYPISANYSGDATHLGSSATGTLTVSRTGGAISVRVKLVKKHHKASVYRATVRVSAGGGLPSGSVRVKLGHKTVGRGTVRNGVAVVSIKVTKLRHGKNKLKLVYAGDANVVGGSKKFNIRRG